MRRQRAGTMAVILAVLLMVILGFPAGVLALDGENQETAADAAVELSEPEDNSGDEAEAQCQDDGSSAVEELVGLQDGDEGIPSGAATIVLTDGVAYETNLPLSSGASVTATFSIPSACFGVFDIKSASNSSMTAKLYRESTLVDEWTPTANEDIHAPVPLHVGSYRLEIASKKDTTVLKSIGYKMSTNSSITSENLEKEPNNAIDTANDLVFGSQNWGSLCYGYSSTLVSDNDYYKFTLSSKKKLSFTAKTAYMGTDFNISLINSNGKTVVTNEGKYLIWGSKNAAADFVLDFTTAQTVSCVLPAGTYYLAVGGSAVGVAGSSLDPSNKRFQMIYSIYPSLSEPPIEADEAYGLLRKDGTIWSCTAEGVPVNSSMSYSDSDRITTLFIEADVTTIPREVTVGDRTFRMYLQLENLRTVTFLTNESGKSACLSVGEDAFYKCTFLTNINGFEKTQVVSIGKSAFEGCSKLLSLSLPPTLKTIEKEAFSGCTILSSITGLEDTILIKVAESAFEGCTSLESLSFPSTLRAIDYYHTFSGCYSLKRIDLPPEVFVSLQSSNGYCRAFESSPYAETVENDAWIYVPDHMLRNYRAIAGTQSWGVHLRPLPPVHKWKRLAGNGRYDTMKSIVNEGWGNITGGTVVVATGSSFKDALSAAGLAGLYDAPVVLAATQDYGITKATEDVLKSLGAKNVIIVGGEAAISDSTAFWIEMNSARHSTTTRVYGRTSASTSAALAMQGKGQWNDSTAIIATNKTFKDALSVAPLSYAKHWPILLADGGKSLNTDVLNALKNLKIKRVIIVGGEAAVTPNVVKQLKGIGITVGENDRIAGETATATSRAIAEFGLRNGMTVKNMAYATSQNYPDALAGAALCGVNKSVLLLADDRATSNLSFSTNYLDGIGIGYVFGGPLAFSEPLFNGLP